MKSNQWTDQDIIQGIRDSKSRDKVLYALFKTLDWRGAAIAFMRQRGGSEQDWEEVANDAFVSFDRSVRNGNFEGRSALKTYFLSIVKNCWWKHLRSRRLVMPLDEERQESAEDSVEDVYLKEEYREAFRLALAQIGERCKQILELAMLEVKMEEIAIAMNLANADMAKKAAYRCRMSMRAFLETHPTWLNRLK